MFTSVTASAAKLANVAFAMLVAGSLVAVASASNETGASWNNTAGQGDPLWAQRTLASSSRTEVARVVSTEVADVVVLGGGHNEGFRDGMACEIVRNGELVAELMIVRCEAQRAAALITALKTDTGIVPGDVARIKTVHLF